MIPNGTSYAQFPSFANNGTKTPPGGSPESAKYALGMVPADTFPAEWANYLFHGATAGITRLNQDTNSIKKELNTILSEYGITNDASAYDQLVGALAKIFPQVCTCSTAAATAAKSVALTGYTRKVGAIFVIEMTNGNTVANPTLTINGVAESTGAICDANGTALGSGAWKDGDTITVLYTGSKYIMATGAVTDTVESGNMSPVTSNAVANNITDNVTVGDMKPVTSNGVAAELSKAITSINTATNITSYTQTNKYTVPADGYVVAVSDNGGVNRRLSIIVEFKDGTNDSLDIARTVLNGTSDKRCIFVRKGMKVCRDSGDDISGNARLEYYSIN